MKNSYTHRNIFTWLHKHIIYLQNTNTPRNKIVERKGMHIYRYTHSIFKKKYIKALVQMCTCVECKKNFVAKKFGKGKGKRVKGKRQKHLMKYLSTLSG